MSVTSSVHLRLSDPPLLDGLQIVGVDLLPLLGLEFVEADLGHQRATGGIGLFALRDVAGQDLTTKITTKQADG